MLELKSAYEILGLSENAGRAELEKRFELLARQYRAALLQKDADAESNAISMDQIREAYNRIISNEKEVLEKEEEKRNPRKPNPLFKLLGVDEKKARNHIYYHKFHYIFGIIGLILLVYIFKTTVFQVKPDLNMAFIGQIYYKDTKVLEKNIKDYYPDIKKISFDSAFFTGNPNDLQDSAALQKAMVLMAGGNIDVYILDKDNFNRYAKQGAFVNLDDLVTKLGIDKSRYQNYVLKPEDQNAKHAYGINIDKSKVLKESQISSKENIVAIGVNAKHDDIAVKILELLIK